MGHTGICIHLGTTFIPPPGIRFWNNFPFPGVLTAPRLPHSGPGLSRGTYHISSHHGGRSCLSASRADMVTCLSIDSTVRTECLHYPGAWRYGLTRISSFLFQLRYPDNAWLWRYCGSSSHGPDVSDPGRNNGAAFPCYPYSTARFSPSGDKAQKVKWTFVRKNSNKEGIKNEKDHYTACRYDVSCDIREYICKRRLSRRVCHELNARPKEGVPSCAG